MEIEITDLKFHKFAIILDNVFTKEECDTLIKLSEKIPENYEIAKISYDDEQILDTSYRNNQRWLNFDKKLAETFFEKIKSYIPIEFEGNPVSCLNERLSFLKYSPGEYFKAHEDGYYIRPDNSEMSYITVQIYLNDLNEEDGGATTFIQDTNNRIYQDYSVIPKVGRVLLFEHELEHEGSILKNGLKYCIRTDVMYSVTKNNNEI
jgi:Rps23 Pro-64 3,4-dihydroxylase Tpa1-like proline 4-hydroxylase